MYREKTDEEAKFMQEGTICRPTDVPQAAVQDVNHAWGKLHAGLKLPVPLAMMATRFLV